MKTSKEKKKIARKYKVELLKRVSFSDFENFRVKMTDL